ncbi:Poly-U binding splicing factor, half-pint family [Aphelenchoides bicaudatus]|nr:Poly-U binding splicing factor, half-pint family [Aphelenchoides bicaudatus]
MNDFMEIEQEEAMPFYGQSEKFVIGPGAKMEAQTLGIGLEDVCSYQVNDLKAAQDFASAVSAQNYKQFKEQHNKQREILYKQLLNALSNICVIKFNPKITKEEFQQAFEVFGPIKTINLSGTRCFLHFYRPEAAICAVNTMDGRELEELTLKIRLLAKLPLHVVTNLIHDAVQKYHRIYVAPVHPNIKEDNLRCLFRAFGKVRRIWLESYRNEQNNNLAYIQFENAEAVEAAINGMNRHLIFGQQVYVCASLTPPDAHYPLFMDSQNAPIAFTPKFFHKKHR